MVKPSWLAPMFVVKSVKRGLCTEEWEDLSSDKDAGKSVEVKIKNWLDVGEKGVYTLGTNTTGEN